VVAENHMILNVSELLLLHHNFLGTSDEAGVGQGC
jgi:hypothetical protein